MLAGHGRLQKWPSRITNTVRELPDEEERKAEYINILIPRSELGLLKNANMDDIYSLPALRCKLIRIVYDKRGNEFYEGSCKKYAEVVATRRPDRVNKRDLVPGQKQWGVVTDVVDDGVIVSFGDLIGLVPFYKLNQPDWIVAVNKLLEVRVVNVGTEKNHLLELADADIIENPQCDGASFTYEEKLEHFEEEKQTQSIFDLGLSPPGVWQWYSAKKNDARLAQAFAIASNEFWRSADKDCDVELSKLQEKRSKSDTWLWVIEKLVSEIISTLTRGGYSLSEKGHQWDCLLFMERNGYCNANGYWQMRNNT